MNDALQILERINAIATTARDVLEYRALIAEAAKAGDLDVKVDTYERTADAVTAFLKED